MVPFGDDDDDDLYDDDLPGNYPASDDIFSRGLVDEEIDPEFIGREKLENEESTGWNEKDFEDDLVGDDLDVPGSELDDEEEIDGNEDEENNYYSLGGDNHNDLEENQGD